ncbi:MAG: hypothetical protein EB059_08050 [Alphaproteobacteria bacterium]|nr:hypothetical protein [Alphaproteobacteria bacterium]
MSSILPLPVIATVKAAYRDVFGDLKAFAGVMWLTLLMMVVFVELPTLMVTQAISKFIHPEKYVEAGVDTNISAEHELPKTDAEVDAVTVDDARHVPPEYVFMLMGLNLLATAILFSFSFAWYRQLLVGEKKGKMIVFHFGKAEWRFAITALKCGFAVAPFMLVMVSFAMASLPEFAGGAPQSLGESMPVFLICGVLMLAIMARVSMSYPLTVMHITDAPIKQSWVMTRQQTLRIVAGIITMVVPLFSGSLLVVIGINYLLNGGKGAPTFAEHLLYKTLGSLFLLVACALISAFTARAYAFLVRSQSQL